MKTLVSAAKNGRELKNVSKDSDAQHEVTPSQQRTFVVTDGCQRTGIPRVLVVSINIAYKETSLEDKGGRSRRERSEGDGIAGSCNNDDSHQPAVRKRPPT